MLVLVHTIFRFSIMVNEDVISVVQENNNIKKYNQDKRGEKIKLDHLVNCLENWSSAECSVPFTSRKKQEQKPQTEILVTSARKTFEMFTESGKK